MIEKLFNSQQVKRFFPSSTVQPSFGAHPTPYLMNIDVHSFVIMLPGN
jgi:hypothetical protein